MYSHCTATRLKGLEAEGGDSNNGAPNVSSDKRPQKYPFQYCLSTNYICQVIPRVLMLIGVEPLNRILVVVWYVITMVTITLKYCH